MRAAWGFVPIAVCGPFYQLADRFAAAAVAGAA